MKFKVGDVVRSTVLSAETGRVVRRESDTVVVINGGLGEMRMAESQLELIERAKKGKRDAR